jgi:hypothetical protein
VAELLSHADGEPNFSDDFDSTVKKAVLLYYLNSGYARFGGLDVVPDLNAVLREVLEAEKLTDKEREAMTEKFE